jgi:hypothetical protein
MGQIIGYLSGSSPVVKRYKASATGYVAGLIVLRSAANASGQMSTSTTTGAGDAIGVLLDVGDNGGQSITYSTTQGADEAVFGVIVNPDAILRMQMVTGDTGTSITGDTIVTASSNGLTAVGGTSVASPDMDEGILWYTSGANVGRSRKITSTSSVTATVIVPFAANAVGDTYCYAGINIGLTGVTLTADLLKVRANVAVSTGAALTCLDLKLAGTTDSYADFLISDHVFSVST